MNLWRWTAAAALALLSAAPSYAQWPRHSWGPPSPNPPPGGWYTPPPWNSQVQPPPPPPPFQPPPPPQNTGSVWVYGSRNEGSFQAIGNGQWVESNPGGQFFYTETRRGRRFVEMYDRSRGIYVRIQGTQLYSRAQSQRNWDTGYSGRWVR